MEKDTAQMEVDNQSKTWTCTFCQCENRLIHFDDRVQIPTSKCRCCGSRRNATDSLRTTRRDIDMNGFTLFDTGNLDPRIVKEWNDMMRDIEQNAEQNKCHGRNGTIIDSCPDIQILSKMMKFYRHYLGKSTTNEYQIDNMTDLVENLQDLGMNRLLVIFEHVSTVHFCPDLFAHFAKEIGSFDSEDSCDAQQRNRDQKDMTDIRRRREKEEDYDSNDDETQPQPQIEENKEVDDVEKHTLSFFDKWHSFLFHPTMTTNDSNDNCSPEPNSRESSTGSEHGPPETNLTTTSSPIMSENRRRGRSIPRARASPVPAASSDYIEYGFGEWIDYTTQKPSFESMRDEMLRNEIHTMTMDEWTNNLMQSLTHWESDKVKVDGKYRAIRTDPRYGIVEGQDIGIENVVAILIYCNFDDLQREFSRTFRSMEEDDTEDVIVERHCRNYYWLGRALFVAIHFYGERMKPSTAVWHGISCKMVFENFATLYFDTPTSTSTSRAVSQGFSGPNGITLKLKSKFKELRTAEFFFRFN